MNALSSLWEKLTRSKKYRDGFAAATVKRIVPLQIRVLRKQRGWSQSQLATESKLTQGVISRAEDPDYGNLTVNTLVRIGTGFDCVFVGRYIPYSDFAKWYVDLGDEKKLEVASFEDDSAFKESSNEELEKAAAAVDARLAQNTAPRKYMTAMQQASQQRIAPIGDVPQNYIIGGPPSGDEYREPFLYQYQLSGPDAPPTETKAMLAKQQESKGLSLVPSNPQGWTEGHAGAQLVAVNPISALGVEAA